MPPESLSTLAVMNPGPSTARNKMIRIRHCFQKSFIRPPALSVGPASQSRTAPVRTSGAPEPPASRLPPPSRCAAYVLRSLTKTESRSPDSPPARPSTSATPAPRGPPDQRPPSPTIALPAPYPARSMPGDCGSSRSAPDDECESSSSQAQAHPAPTTRIALSRNTQDAPPATFQSFPARYPHRMPQSSPQQQNPPAGAATPHPADHPR